MPACFDIESSTGRYAVSIDAGLFDALLGEGGDRIFLADAFLAPRLAAAGIDPIAIVADEPAKSLDRMAEAVVALRERGATRGTTLIAVGGGVVQDVAGFVASIYMRGLEWTYVPTTLLSMTDSCIGGKSSINVGKYKNIVGTFHPPTRVLIDPVLTGTLSAEQKAAGLCESAKICLCRGTDAFNRYLALAPTAEAGVDTLVAVVEHSLRAKKWFIETDEFDKAERLLLNFGHTFGHAIEAASDFGVSHGIAVGLGMLAALNLGEGLGRDYTQTPAVARLRDHVVTLVAAADGLGTALAPVTTERLMDAFRSDKKHTRDRFAAIVVAEDGRVERVMLPRTDEVAAAIARAFADTVAEHRAPALA